MPTFFDLPRELRDIIYNEFLVSPSGLIAPIRNPKRSTLSTQLDTRYSLFYISLSAPQKACHYKTPIQSSGFGDSFSLSLARTCRQIKEETRELFWASNAFYFPSAQNLNATLKGMGQVPSRLIRKITLALPHIHDGLHTHDFSLSALRKALRLLASRSRHGAFEHLTLVIPRPDFIALQNCKVNSDPKLVGLYDGLLEVLREEGAKGGYAREMHVQTLMRNWRVGGGLDHGTIRELHLAWSGKMLVNGEDEWSDYVHVGKCVGFE